MAELKPANQRVLDAAHALGLEIEIATMADSTRTAEDAAAACGCAVGQIVKSLLFKGAETGKPVLMLVSGANRIDEAKVAHDIGEALTRPDARFVREVTGFAIGGVPPIGHASPIEVWIDRDLLAFDTVWAAAGTPHAVFEVSPQALARATSGTVIDVK